MLKTLSPPQVTEQMVSDLSAERVAQQLSFIIPHVMTKIFPWPPYPVSNPGLLAVKVVRPPLLLAGRWVGAK